MENNEKIGYTIRLLMGSIMGFFIGDTVKNPNEIKIVISLVFIVIIFIIPLIELIKYYSVLKSCNMTIK